MIQQLFKPFARGESSRAGNGLGLAITRAAVMRHGGTVAVDNWQGRSGQEVRLHLPDEIPI